MAMAYAAFQGATGFSGVGDAPSITWHAQRCWVSERFIDGAMEREDDQSVVKTCPWNPFMRTVARAKSGPNSSAASRVTTTPIECLTMTSQLANPQASARRHGAAQRVRPACKE